MFDANDSSIQIWGPFLESPGNLQADKYIFKCFFADYTVITGLVLGQCYHRIIRFQNLVLKANKNCMTSVKKHLSPKSLIGPDKFTGTFEKRALGHQMPTLVIDPFG